MLQKPQRLPKGKFKTNSSIKKFKKILIRTIIGIVLFLLLLGIALSLPFVQTRIARYAANTINEDFGTHIQINKVAITLFGSVKLKGVLVLDHHNDTLISASKLQTNLLSFRNAAKSNLQFGDIKADGLIFHLKTYKNEETTNLDVFVNAFDDGKPGSGKFRLRAKNLDVTNSRFRLTNENNATAKILDFKKLNGNLDNFYIKGGDVSTDIQKLSLLDHRGLFVENLKAGFAYTKTNIVLNNLNLVTSESKLSGAVKLTYTREDMKDFVNKVKFDFRVDKASIASNELNYFYNEFGKNQKFYLSTTLEGPLNNFVLHNLRLLDDNRSEIIGEVNFRQLFSKQGPGFYMDGNFDRVSSDYNTLRNIMPGILGKSLPAVLEKLGRVDLVGNVLLTKKDLQTDLYVMSALGEADAKLSIADYNKPDLATYKGIIDLDAFNIGAVIDDKSIGRATAHLNVNGKGFNQKSLNTVVKGDIKSFVFNGYNYTKIDVDGRMKWPYFKGYVNSNDPNLMMSFDGLVDMSKARNNYDFHAQIDYADLVLLNFMKEDTLSIFKGDLLFDASGNNLNNLAGKLQISRLSYQNSLDSYYFEDFFIESSFDDKNIRTITVNSKDIVEGRVRGIYDTKELPELIENALGSLYTNYSPHKVKKGQFLNFDFTIYNKIVEILLPDVDVGANTTLRGRINADKGDFQLLFNSPKISVSENYFNNIRIDVNNKNPLYNAYVSMDSLRTNLYKVSDFSLINVTQNDTLYLRTEFKGGNDARDFFNLNLYHTIDKDNKSVVGFKKSEVNFKDYLWYLNENDSRDNKIVFNKKLTDFTIDKISLSHNDQKMEVGGVIRDSTYKDLKLSFKDVDLEKITPSLDSINFSGLLNGEVSLKQNRSEFQPTSTLIINDLKINKHLLGDLDLQIYGDRYLKKFNVSSSIFRNDEEALYTSGTIEVDNQQTNLSLDASFTDFDIGFLEVFLHSVFPEMRGKASGRAAIVGNIKSPEIDGQLYLKDAGLKVGYLNTDYNFEQNSIVNITERLILFRNIELTDTKYNTKGRLNGSVKHNIFKDWELDLSLTSDRMLVLDTEDSDEALYYGTAFIEGTASIMGPTTALNIDVQATSANGTDIKIPINNTSGVGNSSFIHFTSPEEKKNKGKGIQEIATRTYKGLEMNFDLTITPDAHLEVIIDKNTGHSLMANGNGNLLLEINTLGKFNMWGDFQVREGLYNFKYGGLLDKKFVVREGGYLVWEGDPTKARLNLEAVYKTQANPSILLENPNFNRNIPVEVVIMLNGNLSNPQPDFAIEFPSVSSVVKSDLEYRLSDNDMRQRQALSLLYSRTFLSPTNANSVAYGSLFETASSLFNDIFADDDSKVQVGFNYVQADRNPYVETNSQLGLTLSSQINDRITINGQLGVPVGGVNESVIVGNVEIQLRLNEDGTLKARVFNRENDINFLGEGINYTQGVGLTYEVDFDTFRELLREIFKKAQKKETDTNNPANDIPDSDLSPEFIKWTESRNKKKQNNQNQPNRIPETD
ncbi:translocation/assembly module TamB domain-containing protein [Flavobacterium sp. MK4S-17]|uniref:translocation/assembly module TamB domain-containing protein n=1 Tax=Flavobacterium sp. MK4S-17 TaxID=2543737 RepID=UPI001F453503|nr:translocation/assembly module TamB domain-containing protein [Flavobacterium sp. MK4S-17]